MSVRPPLLDHAPDRATRAPAPTGAAGRATAPPTRPTRPSGRPRSWRRAVWLAHSWLGLASAVFLVLISVSGALLVFGPELGEAAQPAITRVAPGPALPLDRVLARAVAPADVPTISFWDIAAGPGHVHRLVLGDDPHRRWLLIDPATGRVTGRLGNGGTLFNQVRVFHWSFLLPGRPGGLAAAVVGILLAASSVTGVVVLRRVWAPFARPVRWRAGLRTLTGDWHRLVGAASLLFNLLWGITGAWMNRSFLLPEEAAEAPPAAPATPIATAWRVSLDTLVRRAEGAGTGFHAQSLEWPRGTSDTLRVYGAVDGAPWYLASGGFPHVDLSVRTGSVIERHDGRPTTAAEWADAVGATLHYGRFGGWPVKLLYTLLGLAPAVLAATGAMVWWTRGRRWLAAAPRTARAPRRAAA